MARKSGSSSGGKTAHHPAGGAGKSDHAQGTQGHDTDHRSGGSFAGAFALGAAAVVVGAGLFGAFTRTGRRLVDEGLAAGNRAVDASNRALAKSGITPGSAEHVPTDLMGDTHPGPDSRAPADFRPDMDAPMSAAEREALRPPQGPGPTLVAGQSEGNLRTNAAQS